MKYQPYLAACPVLGLPDSYSGAAPAVVPNTSPASWVPRPRSSTRRNSWTSRKRTTSGVPYPPRWAVSSSNSSRRGFSSRVRVRRLWRDRRPRIPWPDRPRRNLPEAGCWRRPVPRRTPRDHWTRRWTWRDSYSWAWEPRQAGPCPWPRPSAPCSRRSWPYRRNSCPCGRRGWTRLRRATPCSASGTSCCCSLAGVAESGPSYEVTCPIDPGTRVRMRRSRSRGDGNPAEDCTAPRMSCPRTAPRSTWLWGPGSGTGVATPRKASPGSRPSWPSANLLEIFLIEWEESHSRWWSRQSCRWCCKLPDSWLLTWNTMKKKKSTLFIRIYSVARYRDIEIPSERLRNIRSLSRYYNTRDYRTGKCAATRPWERFECNEQRDEWACCAKIAFFFYYEITWGGDAMLFSSLPNSPHSIINR